MSDLVAPEDIERIVGAARHPRQHYGRAVSSEQTVYVLHSKACKDSGIDLRDCPFSLALDQGISQDTWNGFEDVPVELIIMGEWWNGADGHLAPLRKLDL
jgi:hypothetical protein